MLTNKKLLLITFLILNLITFLYLKQEKEKKIEKHLKLKTHQYLKSYNVLYNKYKALSTIVFETKIDTAEIKSIFQEAHKANLAQQEKIREDLLETLKDTYKVLKLYNIRQLHFHLPNNESFLRFHKPNKFGDNLSTIRSTVQYVNKNKKPIDGFEEGRIYNGYRFVWPLFYQNEHIGSVEISFSTLSMNIEMMKNYDVVGKFLIAKEIVETKVFSNEKENYAQSSFEDFYYEREIEKELEKYNQDKFNLKVSQSTRDIVHKKRHELNSFSLYDEASNSVMTFLKIKNPVSDFAVGLFVLRNDASFINIQNEIFYKAIVSVLVVLSLISFILYRILNEKNKLTHEVARKTKELNRSKKEMENYIKIIDKNIIASSTDTNGVINYVSKAFCDISGYSKEELLNQKHSIIKDINEPKSKYKQIWETIQNNATWKGEIRNRKKNGELYWVDATISPLFYNKKKIGYTAIHQDITDKKTIEKISQTDRLTKVYNRLKLDEVLMEEIDRNKRYETKFSIILLDIDKFKSINDTYGHLIGDEVLIEFAKIISSNIRKTDIVGRWGGEEFLIICKNTDVKGAVRIAETLRFYIEQTNFKSVGDVTASFGVTEYYHNEDEEKMLKRADDALYFCKKNGRNQVKVFLKDSI